MFLTRAFSVWPVAQPVVGEMEMRSVANLATLQTPLTTFPPLFKKAPSDKSLAFAQILYSFWGFSVQRAAETSSTFS